MTTVTACMIVRDEAEFLPECLNSVKQLTDDIVIVDTGSTDDTMRIASDFGCKVIQRAWTDDFSAARNQALEHASGQFVFTIDADERVRLFASRGELDSQLRQTRCHAFKATVQSYVGSPSRSQVPFVDERIVLVRNHANLRYIHRVHEDITPSLSSSFGDPLQITSIPLMIEHFGYLDDVVARRNKRLRNIRLLELEIAEHGASPWSDYCLGVEWAGCEEWEKAVHPLARVVQHAVASPFWEIAAQTLAYCYLQLDCPDKCINVCDKLTSATAVDPARIRILRSIAAWQSEGSIANMLSSSPRLGVKDVEEYTAFLFAYQLRADRLFKGYDGQWSDDDREQTTR